MQDVKGSFKCDRIKGKGFTWKQKTDEKNKEEKTEQRKIEN